MDSAQVVFRYFHDLTPGQKDQIDRLGGLYASWNEKINLISRKDIEALYERHILHSLAIAKFLQFRPGTRILDVGTGGGLPGIPLAIYFPQVDFTLVDSIGKKIKAVRDIADILQLNNVQPICTRVEKLNGQFDFAVARAVTQITPFYSWTKSKIMPSFTQKIPNGILYLKGGDLKDELKEFGKPCEIIELKDYFREPFFDAKKLVFIPIAQ